MQEPIDLALSGPDKKIIIGRNDARTEVKADLDLGPYDAAKKGVSRNHVALYINGSRLIVRDLNTSNGTTLNGQRLNPEHEYIMTGSDTLILGAFRVNVQIPVAPSGAFDDLNAADARLKTGRLPEQKPLVLVVEDDVEVAELFSLVLKKHGYDTQISRDANRAMRYLSKKQPDAVILDLNLPGMNGTEVSRYIRRDTSLDQTAVIIVSSRRDAGIERSVYDAGADAFLSKPVKPELLQKTVTDIIRKRRTGEDITRELSDSDRTKTLEDDDTTNLPGVRDDTVAVVVAGYTDRPFTVTVSRPMTFGRGAYASANTHVDLSRFSAGERGVSRMHMRLTREDGTFYIEDLDSVNGTYLGGVRIPANEHYEIESGTEIRMGQLVMNVYFNTSSDA
ncbi:MAG: FHA domain-containing protein [Chloroflexota bacterium]